MIQSTVNIKNSLSIITSILRNNFNQIVAVALSGLLLRFYELNVHGFRWDELFILLNSKRPFESIDTITPPPLFSYLVRLFHLLVQNDEFTRIVPAAIGAITIPVMYKVMRRWQNHESSLWGALIVALSPLQIFYSQDLTMYSLVMLESLLALYFWDRLLDEGRFADFFWYSVVMIAGFQTHQWFAFVFLSQMTWLFFFTPVDQRFRMGLYGIITVGLVSAELQPDSFFNFHAPYFFWLKTPSISDVLRTCQVFLFGIAPPMGSWSPMNPGLAAALLSVSLLAIAAGFIVARNDWVRRVRVAFVGLFGPLAIGFGYSYLIAPVYSADNHALIAYPAFIICVCAVLGLREGWSRRLSQGIGGIYCLLCAVLLVFYFKTFEKAPWKNIARIIESVPQPRAVDTSALGTVDRETLRYYMGRIPTWQGPQFWRDGAAGSGPAENVHLALPIRAGREHDIQNALPPDWKLNRVVYSNDVVVFLMDKTVGK